MTESGSLFEFSEPGDGQRWIARPGKKTAFPLSIRNETAEGQDVAVLVEQPANWAWADPPRISLDPGESATVSIVFAPQKETTVAAGAHQVAIRLRDLEGVIFAECIQPFEVEERQELAMTVSLRGPLMSFGLAEGFVLHCTLANRGNVDASVTPAGDPHPTLTFSERTVSVPFQGEVAFDIDVRWNATQRSNHPDIVTLRAPYQGGEATASIEWRYIAEALEPFMPIYSTAEEDDELLSLSWLPQPDEDLLDHRIPDFVPEDSGGAGAAQAGAGADPAPAGTGEQSGGLQAPGAPARVSQLPYQRLASRRAQYAPSRRLNPWWPVVQRIGGKWRVKPLTILMLIIAIEGFIIGMTQAQRDYYASPELRGRVPPVTRVLQASSRAAVTLIGYGKRAISVTLNEGAKLTHNVHIGRGTSGSETGGVPVLWGLEAHYVNPHTLAVSFHEVGCTDLKLLVASGTKVVYEKPASGDQATVPIPRGLTEPLRITVTGEAPGGIELRQHVYLALPLAR